MKEIVEIEGIGAARLRTTRNNYWGLSSHMMALLDRDKDVGSIFKSSNRYNPKWKCLQTKKARACVVAAVNAVLVEHPITDHYMIRKARESWS